MPGGDRSFRSRRLPPVTENNLLRIGQEAIANAARHARARRIDVRLEFTEREVLLSVRDDGQGFDASQPAPGRGGRRWNSPPRRKSSRGCRSSSAPTTRPHYRCSWSRASPTTPW
jgi:hypothetical protein